MSPTGIQLAKEQRFNPPTPLILGTEQGHYQPPQGINHPISHPHSREQVPYKHLYSTSAAPAQTSFQEHGHPKAKIQSSVVLLRVKHTPSFLADRPPEWSCFFPSSWRDLKCHLPSSPVFPPFSLALFRGKFWASSHNAHTLPPCLIEVGGWRGSYRVEVLLSPRRQTSKTTLLGRHQLSPTPTQTPSSSPFPGFHF